MKKNNLFSRLVLALKTALTYWCRHSESLAAMEALYVREWWDGKTMDRHLTWLRVTRTGNLYQVSLDHLTNGLPVKKDHWLATYGWSSSGHLSGIGTDRCVIFDSAQKLVYLHEYQQDGEYTVDCYQQV